MCFRETEPFLKTSIQSRIQPKCVIVINVLKLFRIKKVCFKTKVSFMQSLYSYSVYLRIVHMVLRSKNTYTMMRKSYQCFFILCQRSFIFLEGELTAFLKGVTQGRSTLLSVLGGNIVLS